MKYRKTTLSQDDATWSWGSVTSTHIELIKWVALLLMTADHLNKYLWHGRYSWVFFLGRLALPMFCMALAFSLARPGADLAARCQRAIKRQLAAGVVASVPFIALGGLVGGWWPLNVLLTLLVGTTAIWMHCRRVNAAWVACFVALAGAFVEFCWPGAALTLAAWRYFRSPTRLRLAVLVATTASLTLIGWALGGLALLNASAAAVLALPFCWALTRAPLSRRIPQMRRFFYAFYPAHLAIIWLASVLISPA